MLISLLITVIFGFLYFYVKLPALNMHSPDLYLFVYLLCIVYCGSNIFVTGFRASSAKDYFKHLIKKCTVPVIIGAVFLAISAVGGIAGSVIFRAKTYAELLPMQQGDFSKEVEELKWDQIPMLDADSANTLANKKMGELSDLVSQFEVDGASAQINYQDRPVRATYLNYGDLIKWFNNRGEGIPAYLLIDMVTQEVSVQRLEEGMKYSPSEPLNRNIHRYLRFHYPTKMFYDVNFEVDDDGVPYWCATTVTNTIGLFGGTDVTGAVLVNAVTGESQFYEIGDVPSWVDRVCSSELILQQYDYYGLYQGGFWNSVLGQSGCTKTTTGYNYIAMDDDVWVYTGITSVGGDESNLGFILVNQRTKEARYYACAGANEQAGMNSAQGAVQQYSYQATFPILLNIGNEPTYFMALKDASQLVKMYAMVNVSQYQIVATGTTVEECQANYMDQLVKSGIAEEEKAPEAETGEVTGRVAELRSAVMDGDTYYFIRLAEQPVYYLINGREYPVATILNVEDKVTIQYELGEGEIVNGISLERK